MTTNISNITSASESINVKSISKNNENLVSSFQSVMSSVGNQNYTAQNQETYIASSKSERTEPDRDTASKVEVSGNKKLNDTNTKVSKTSKSGKTKDMDELRDKANEVVDAIRQEIQTSLNISEQDLNRIMESLGLTDADLLDNQNVLLIAMEQAGISDNVALFENQDLVDTLKGLMEQLQEIKNELQGVDMAAIQEALGQQDIAEEMMEATAVLDDNADSELASVDNQATIADGEEESLIKNNEQQFNNANHHSSSDDGMMGNSFAASNTAVQNLTQALMNSQQTSYSSQAQAVDIINQIVEGIKSSIKPGTTQLDVQLNPESLGKVNVTLVSKEGMISAQIAAQTEVAKHAIEGQITILKEAFQSQGLKVEAVEVSVSPQGFDMKQQDGSSDQNHSASQPRRQINLEDLDIYEDDLSEEEAIAIDMMQRSGSSVDFTA